MSLSYWTPTVAAEILCALVSRVSRLNPRLWASLPLELIAWYAYEMAVWTARKTLARVAMAHGSVWNGLVVFKVEL